MKASQGQCRSQPAYGLVPIFFKCVHVTVVLQQLQLWSDSRLSWVTFMTGVELYFGSANASSPLTAQIGKGLCSRSVVLCKARLQAIKPWLLSPESLSWAGPSWRLCRDQGLASTWQSPEPGPEAMTLKMLYITIISCANLWSHHWLYNFSATSLMCSVFPTYRWVFVHISLFFYLFSRIRFTSTWDDQCLPPSSTCVHCFYSSKDMTTT